MGDFRVNLDALEGFADQLQQRLDALQSTRPVASTLPLGGAPAWEGQALFDAYYSRANDVRDLLQSLQTAVQDAVTKARDQAQQVRRTDENSEQNNRTNENALGGGGGQVA